jgi:hypothetical protein
MKKFKSIVTSIRGHTTPQTTAELKEQILNTFNYHVKDAPIPLARSPDELTNPGKRDKIQKEEIMALKKLYADNFRQAVLSIDNNTDIEDAAQQIRGLIEYQNSQLAAARTYSTKETVVVNEMESEYQVDSGGFQIAIPGTEHPTGRTHTETHGRDGLQAQPKLGTFHEQGERCLEILESVSLSNRSAASLD